jgi:hypothetical protein
MVTTVVLEIGMKISEQELLDQGCQFVSNFALNDKVQELLDQGYRFVSNFDFNDKVFKKDNQFIYWNAETQTIWRIL